MAIIGGGISGYTLALSLRKLCPQLRSVTLFERRGEEEPAAGAAFNLNGGAAVLRDLGVDLTSLANPMARVLGRTVSGFTLLDVDVAQAIRAAGVDTERLLTRDGASVACTVMRSELLERLSAQLSAPDGSSQTVLELRRGLGVSSVAPDGRLTLSDGTVSDAYDLVIGADGIRSATRDGLAAPGQPEYTGIRITFAVSPRDSRDTAQRCLLRDCPPSEIHQWFGPGSYALCFTAGGEPAPQHSAGGGHCLALSWREAQASSDNAGWAQAPLGEARADLLQRLQAGGYPDETIRMARSAERIFTIGVFHHQPMSAPWSRSLAGGARVVLLGDAAHAMPPFLGQGANQAVQDAYCLAAQLAALHSGRVSSLDAALAAYESVRRPPTAALQRSSWAVGLLDTLPTPWSPIRDLALAVAGASGIAGTVFVAGATPRV